MSRPNSVPECLWFHKRAQLVNFSRRLATEGLDEVLDAVVDGWPEADISTARRAIELSRVELQTAREVLQQAILTTRVTAVREAKGVGSAKGWVKVERVTYTHGSQSGFMQTIHSRDSSAPSGIAEGAALAGAGAFFNYENLLVLLQQSVAS